MKTSKDPRHLRRKKTLKALFSLPFQTGQALDDQLARQVQENTEKIDAVIAESAPEWSINKINRVDLAILRLAVWEMVIEKKTPPKVIIDEAVELAKRYGTESSPRFVNGALGTVLIKMKVEN